MDSEIGKSVVLLAIKPKYAEAILAGRKTVEFRKTVFRRPPQYVVIYESFPIMKVVGYFHVGHLDEDAPARLWNRHKTHGGIEREDFDEYYRKSPVGVAIVLKDVSVLKVPITLAALDGQRAPQSFRYLSPKHLSKLMRMAVKRGV